MLVTQPMLCIGWVFYELYRHRQMPRKALKGAQASAILLVSG